MATNDSETYADLVNDASPPEVLAGMHPNEAEFRLIFSHMIRSRPSKPSKPQSLGKQIGVLKSNPVLLGREVEALLGMLGDILKQSWTNWIDDEFAKAVKGAFPIHVDDKARTVFVNRPTDLRSAIRVVTSLSKIVRAFGLMRIDIRRVYDIELEAEKIVIGLKTSSNPNEQFECETKILSYLDEQLSDNDKLRIAVRAE
jgi:hypothetical protein